MSFDKEECFDELYNYFTKKYTAREIDFGLCILQAKGLSGDETYENEHYWYTREKCSEIARKEKVSWMKIMMFVNEARLNKSITEIFSLSQSLWIEVMHPEILIEEVMDI